MTEESLILLNDIQKTITPDIERSFADEDVLEIKYKYNNTKCLQTEIGVNFLSSLLNFRGYDVYKLCHHADKVLLIRKKE